MNVWCWLNGNEIFGGQWRNQPTPPITAKNRHQQIISMAFDIHAVCLSLHLYVSVDVTNYDLSNILVSGVCVWVSESKSTSFGSDSSVLCVCGQIHGVISRNGPHIVACRIHRFKIWNHYASSSLFRSSITSVHFPFNEFQEKKSEAGEHNSYSIDLEFSFTSLHFTSLHFRHTRMSTNRLHKVTLFMCLPEAVN